MAAEPLAGRSALVTGASRGIGRECARLLMESGARVAMLSRNLELMNALIRELGQNGSAFRADLSDPDTFVPVLQKARDWIGGAPDIIVSNAGAFSIAPLEDTPIDALKTALRLNVASPFLLVRHFLADLKKENRGHIVTIGSVADRAAYPGNALYSATKFGARGMHEVLREETRGTGVRATLVSPGPTDTEIWDAVDPDSRPGFTPRAKMMKPGDVARAVLWAVTQPAHVNVDELRLSRT